MAVKSPNIEISTRATKLLRDYSDAVAQYAMRYAHKENARKLIANEYHFARLEVDKYIAYLEDKVNGKSS